MAVGLTQMTPLAVLPRPRVRQVYDEVILLRAVEDTPA